VRTIFHIHGIHYNTVWVAEYWFSYPDGTVTIDTYKTVVNSGFNGHVFLQVNLII